MIYPQEQYVPDTSETRDSFMSSHQLSSPSTVCIRYVIVNFNVLNNLGWVCYAEKTHGTYSLPYIATTKSPQQIMGSLVKQWMQSHAKDQQIYHVTVMPCYDKKLEASRPDFLDENTQSREVDCVITASKFKAIFVCPNKISG